MRSFNMRAMIPPTDCLRDPLPAEPLDVAAEWLAEACRRRATPNANAMTLATATPEGMPSARIVLCKEIAARPGYVVFYTNYGSRKGGELAANPRAAAVLHFDALHCQVRIEGVVERSPPQESDAYFASRPLQSRIGAWASEQSAPIASRAALRAAVTAAAQRFNVAADPALKGEPPEPAVPRPAHWGGYRLWAQAVELWVQGEARLHDRARWSRRLDRLAGEHIAPGPWTVTRLQP